VFKAVDTNQDGKITENELSKAIAARGSKQGPSASEIMKQLDQGNKGYITKQDLDAGLAKVDQTQKAQGTAPGVAGGSEAPAGGERGSVGRRRRECDNLIRPSGSQPGRRGHSAGGNPVRNDTLRRVQGDAIRQSSLLVRMIHPAR
jgi:hypothetical protein